MKRYTETTTQARNVRQLVDLIENGIEDIVNCKGSRNRQYFSGRMYAQGNGLCPPTQATKNLNGVRQYPLTKKPIAHYTGLVAFTGDYPHKHGTITVRVTDNEMIEYLYACENREPQQIVPGVSTTISKIRPFHVHLEGRDCDKNYGAIVESVLLFLDAAKFM